MVRLRPLLVALLTLVAATVVVQTAVAAARPPGRGEHVSLNRTGYTAAQSQATLDYWTPERIAAAKPMPLLGTPRPMPTATRSARGKDWVPQRPAYIVPPTRPLTPVDQLPPFAATDGAEAPWQPLQAPARTSGKLFARFDLGDVAMDAHCTAEVVNSEAKNMVMSAAHCLYYDLTDDGQDNPVRATNLMFLAGYRDGQFITDRWTVGATVLFSNWMATGDPDFDLAILLMNDLPSWSGEIANVLDAQGIGFNLDQTTLGQVTAPGYSIAPFNPERLSYCSGNVTVMDDRASALPCRLTEGASGTPWLTQFDAQTGFGLVTAVSVKTSPGGSEDYGLVLTDPALDAYNRTRTDRGDAYPSGVSRSYWTPEERAAALDHWTAERMAAAEPARLPDDDPLPTFTRRGTRVQSDPEPPAIVQPLDPRNPDASPLTPEEALPPLDATDGAAWQGPPGDFPARTVGKLFFVRAGKDQHCSAGVVRSEAQNMVFTAGHCLYGDDTDDGVDNPERSTDITFAPGYRDGPSSLGTWTPYARVEFGLWVDDLDTAWDFAILSMDPDPTGAQLETVTGAQGIGFNVRLDGRPAAVLGYSALLFDPAKPSYCAGAIEAESFLTKTLPCTLSHGASGSPWLTQFDHTTGFGLTVAVTSSTKRFHVRSVGFGALHLEAYNLARLG